MVFLAVGVLGLVTTPLNMAGGMLLSLFPVNVLHNLVHLAFGVWALAAARSFSGAKTFARVGGVIYLALVVFALITPTTFGLMPIGGHDIWLHGLIGLVLAFVGFARTR